MRIPREPQGTPAAVEHPHTWPDHGIPPGSPDRLIRNSMTKKASRLLLPDRVSSLKLASSLAIRKAVDDERLGGKGWDSHPVVRTHGGKNHASALTKRIQFDPSGRRSRARTRRLREFDERTHLPFWQAMESGRHRGFANRTHSCHSGRRGGVPRVIGAWGGGNGRGPAPLDAAGRNALRCRSFPIVEAIPGDDLNMVSGSRWIGVLLASGLMLGCGGSEDGLATAPGGASRRRPVRSVGAWR